MEEKKVFPVFSVDVCFDPYSMSQILVGAESVEDLIKNLKPIVRYKKDRDKISKEREWRIVKVPNLYTDKPYEVLDRYSYYE